jgi:hypothetical protein
MHGTQYRMDSCFLDSHSVRSLETSGCSVRDEKAERREKNQARMNLCVIEQTYTKACSTE